LLAELYVGLDIHRLTTVATILDPEGHRVDQPHLTSADAKVIAYLGEN
jgi:hypothetical protein